MINVKNLAKYFIVVTQCLGASAMAAQIEPDLLELPWIQIAVGASLALWGGLTRTAENVLRSRRRAEDINIRAELLRDILVSSGVGLLVSLIGIELQWSTAVLGASLWVGGYAGSALLQAFKDRATTMARGYVLKEDSQCDTSSVEVNVNVENKLQEKNELKSNKRSKS